jgi:hypothetical protein
MVVGSCVGYFVAGSIDCILGLDETRMVMHESDCRGLPAYSCNTMFLRGRIMQRWAGLALGGVDLGSTIYTQEVCHCLLLSKFDLV